MMRASGPARAMSRPAELVFVCGSGGLAAFGVLLVNLAREQVRATPALAAFLVLAVAFGLLLVALRAWAPDATPLLIPIASILAAVGFVTIYRLDEDLASLHGWWLLLSAAMAAFWLYAVSEKGLGHRGGRWWLLLALAAGLVVIPSSGSDSSTIWLAWNSGRAVVLNPGEIVKLVTVALFATLLSERQAFFSAGGRYTAPLGPARATKVWPSLLLLGFVLVGVAIRDSGTFMIVVGMFCVMAYMATNRTAYLVGGLGAGVLWLVAGPWLSAGLENRITVWTDPWTHPEGPGSRLAEGLFGLAAGSLSGTGLGLGDPDLIPESTTSLAFAAVGEELGLAGTVVVLAAYALIVVTGFGIALRAREVFHKLLASGLSLLLGGQAAVSVAGVVGLLPGTAMPIPFLSYGLSLTMAGFLMLAVLARVSHEERV
ncbi:MAG: FtsW/RodA/SpoVE family cell cycle protein [Acidimicrobiia bacterium]|nr:FtsW/RodA/SpoVE family cell cycle protein [Acidimicrobiia bacterium]MYC84993.1 FtsW/RodA/SpoVE family cell cycle protein [Acidimicrobiia bacterium]